jgi:hypothetical protein
MTCKEFSETMMAARKSPPEAFYRPERRHDPHDLLIAEGNLFEEIPLSKIRKLGVTPGQHPWLNAEVELTSGRVKTGRIPNDEGDWWLNASEFRFLGKRIVLGAQGNVGIDISRVRSLERSPEKPDTYVMTDSDGETIEVYDLELTTYWSAPLQDAGRIGMDVSKIRIIVQNTAVQIMLKDIESIATHGDQNDFKLKMKSGEEAIATDIDPFHIYGRLESGRIWFGQIYQLKPRFRTISFK